jgi:hypothetical protein
MPGMRNVVLIAIVLALAVAAIRHESDSSSSSGSSSSSTTKSSSETKFLAAQHKYDRMWGDRATDDELLVVGRTICTLHKKGMSDSDILRSTAGYRLPTGSKARTLGLQRIRDAKKYLCP